MPERETLICGLGQQELLARKPKNSRQDEAALLVVEDVVERVLELRREGTGGGEINN